MRIVQRLKGGGLIALALGMVLSLADSGLASIRWRGPASAGAVELPDTAAGRRAKILFDLFNDKIKISSTEFVRQNCSEAFKSQMAEAAWGGPIDQLKAQAGPFELVSIDKSEPGSLSFLMRSASRGMSFRIQVDVQPAAPNLIASLLFQPAGQGGGAPGPEPASAKPAPSPAPDLDSIKVFLAEQARQGKFSGAALIAKDGKPLLRETAGLASKRFRAPNRIDTKFNLGSLNKSFTAVAVLQLVEAGKIGIDDPIGKYLDFFPKEVGEKVKVRHLLTMGNGWGDYWQHPYFLQHKDDLRSVAQYMEFIKTMPLDFEPGTKTQHSNTGYDVAGALIEKVSGSDYFSYIREHIYKPAGMADTDSYDRDSFVENLAVGYTNMHPRNANATDFRWENTYILSPKGTPAGGGYSTVEDMLKFDAAIRSGKLLGKTFVDFLQNRYAGKIGDPFVPQRVSRSAGGANGVSTFFGRDLRNGYTIIILTNVDNPAAIEIGDEIIKRMGLE